MKHYEIMEWTDYVRGVVGGNRGKRMGDHLAAGCVRCGNTQAALRQVADVVEKDSRLDLAEGVVRSAKALFALRQPARAQGLTHLALQLVFDSSLQPAPAGVRGTDGGSRRLVFRAEDMALDLVVSDREAATSDLRLSGELVSSEAGPMEGVAAQLIEEDEVVDESLTGSLGEFAISCERPQTTRLRLLLGDGECIDLPLNL